jgi:1-acyl-sn-glycerol-3-phosphate acyltransferase
MMFYYFARSICAKYLKIFNKWTVEGKENLPSNGPVVMVGNHNSLWDPLVIGCSIDRPIHFMAKEELFRIPIISKLVIEKLCAFPVKRGQADRNALRIASELLKKGEMLGMFPEGTRSRTGELLSFHPGAALFALRSSAPIVPAALIGTKTTFPNSLRGNIKVRIGKPLAYTDLYNKKITAEDMERVTSEVMECIRQLMKDGN